MIEYKGYVGKIAVDGELYGTVMKQRWGEPRETVDVDLTLLTGFGGEGPFIHALLDRYEGRIDDAAGFARANRVLLLRAGPASASTSRSAGYRSGNR